MSLAHTHTHKLTNIEQIDLLQQAENLNRITVIEIHSERKNNQIDVAINKILRSFFYLFTTIKICKI